LGKPPTVVGIEAFGVFGRCGELVGEKERVVLGMVISLLVTMHLVVMQCSLRKRSSNKIRCKRHSSLTDFTNVPHRREHISHETLLFRFLHHRAFSFRSNQLMIFRFRTNQTAAASLLTGSNLQERAAYGATSLKIASRIDLSQV
jgi:hypothetical protein